MVSYCPPRMVLTMGATFLGLISRPTSSWLKTIGSRRTPVLRSVHRGVISQWTEPVSRPHCATPEASKSLFNSRLQFKFHRLPRLPQTTAASFIRLYRKRPGPATLVARTVPCQIASDTALTNIGTSFSERSVRNRRDLGPVLLQKLLQFRRAQAVRNIAELHYAGTAAAKKPALAQDLCRHRSPAPVYDPPGLQSPQTAFPRAQARTVPQAGQCAEISFLSALARRHGASALRLHDSEMHNYTSLAMVLIGGRRTGPLLPPILSVWKPANGDVAQCIRRAVP